MTVEKCIKLLALYKERMDNPQGADEVERTSVRRQSTKAYEDMKAHILKSRKFLGNPVVEELKGKVEEVKVEEVKEEKKDGKKSKG